MSTKMRRRTGVELDLADHEPSSVELESNGEDASDEVMQRHGHRPRRLGQRVALVLVAPAGRRAVSGRRLADEHRGRGEHANVAMKQVVAVNTHHAEVTHAVEPALSTPRLRTIRDGSYEVQQIWFTVQRASNTSSSTVSFYLSNAIVYVLYISCIFSSFLLCCNARLRFSFVE